MANGQRPKSTMDPLDDDFDLGDGTADVEADVICPYCGEDCTIALDPGGGTTQEYVEDCPICCQAWQVAVHYDEEGIATVGIARLDGEEA